MSSFAAIPTLDKKGLREFGLTTGAIVAGLFGVFFPWVFAAPFPLWPWIFFAVLAGWAIAAPLSLNPIYRGWMRIGLLLGKVTTPIILGAVFFLVVFPMAIVLKLLRWDPMKRKFDKASTTYRVASTEPTSESLERPF